MSLSSENNLIDRTPLKRCLRHLEQDVLRMAALVENSFRLSHSALFARDLETAREIPLLDKQIDRYCRQIEQDCVNLMTLQAPVAQEWRLISAFMQLVRDLERIGDYAKDLAEIAIKLFPYQPHSCFKEIEVMSLHARAMLAQSLSALADLDATAGRAVEQLDDTVDIAYSQVYQTLAQERDIKGVVEPILLLTLVIRHLERMADHATNIGERVSYIVTGRR